jgi:hypothetical protein
MLRFFEVLETNCPVTPRHIEEEQYPLPHCHENIDTHGMWQALPTEKNNLLGELFSAHLKNRSRAGFCKASMCSVVSFLVHLIMLCSVAYCR